MSAPSAAILSVGDEIVLGQQADTNSGWIAEALCALGVMVTEVRTVADDRAAIAQAMRDLAARSVVLITTGGLGPTEDDLTRTALNDVIGEGTPLVEDPQGIAWLSRWFAGRARPMPDSNRVQAMRPRASSLLANAHGTAPGLAATVGGCRLFCLPGPPREMQPMFHAAVGPVVRAAAGGEVIRTAVIRQVGLGESEAAERLGVLMARGANPQVGTTASGGIVSARIRARGRPDDADALLRRTTEQVHEAWRPYAFAEGDETLATAVHRLLRDARATVAVAESCTGGLVGSMLVEPPGASDVVLGGWITYSDAMKIAQLGVDPALVATHGAVSAAVVSAMAINAAARAGATMAIATSGIAGPGGGSDRKPIGTVHVAVADCRAARPRIDARRFNVTGTRDDVRDRSARLALQMLRLNLLGAAARPLLWQIDDAAETTADPSSAAGASS